MLMYMSVLAHVYIGCFLNVFLCIWLCITTIKYTPVVYIIMYNNACSIPQHAGVTRFFLGWALLVAESARLSSSSNRPVISSKCHSWQWIWKTSSPASSPSDIILGVITFYFSQSDSRTLLLLLSCFYGDIQKENITLYIAMYMYTCSYPY